MSLLADAGITLIKAVVALNALLGLAAFIIWVERKGSALVQDRVGANRAAILGFDLAGLINTLVADPVKALFKEDFVPKDTGQFMHSLAPMLAVVPVLVTFAVVPFGPPVIVFGREVSLQVAHLDAGILFVFAMVSLSVYGTMLAGWVSNNKYSLLGSLRASAQMVSYEVTMGLSIIGVLAGYGTLDLQQMVLKQSGTVLGVLPAWGIFQSPFYIIAFLIFFASVMAETKRVPFDLPESESEIVAGYFTEYSGMKFLLFWLAEFAEIVVASTLIVLLFFGGWQLPYVDLASKSWGAPLAAAVLAAKVLFFCLLQVVLRWTLPRFRYDHLMAFCWKMLLPLSLVNFIATAAWQLWRAA